MSTREDRAWDAEQDRISDDQHARKVGEAIASPAAVVDSLLATLEGGEISTVDGGIVFEHDGLPVTLTFNSAEQGGVAATLWVEDENEDPVEVANLRLRVEVLS